MDDPVRFRILGHLAVETRTGPVDLPAAKQGTALAVLLASANRVVSADALADALWGGDAPASGTLRWHIHRLRRILGDLVGDETRIHRAGGGYVLVVRPGELDAQRFESLSAQGAEALADGDPARARGLLSEALELWRGDAYAEFGEVDALVAETVRLNEARLQTLERRVDADLATGSHAEVVPELSTLVAQHPLREGLRSRLMLALYRSGRTADALEVFRRGRERSTAELGLEPGPGLRRLEIAILQGDPSLDTPQPGRTTPAPDGSETSTEPPPARPTPPAELPADPTGFTGRDQEIAELVSLLRSDRASLPIAAISGPSGVGKSTLAVHAAHTVSRHFPDGQLYANLRGATPGLRPLQPIDVLGRFIRSLGMEPPADVDEAAARFRSLTARLRVLILLDDVRDTEQVRHLLPSGAGCAVLLTSRRMLTGLDGAVHHRLEVLGGPEALALLGRIAGHDRIAAEPDAAADVVRLCGGLPLALSVATGRFTTRPTWTVRALADRLADQDRRLDVLQESDRAVRTSLAAGYGEMDLQSGRLFRLLGLLDLADISVPVAAVLADSPEPNAEYLLEELVDAQLLETPGPGRYALHDLTRLFARERAIAEEPEDARNRAVRRVLHLYLATARRAQWMLGPCDDEWLHAGVPMADLTAGGVHLSDRQAAIDWFDREAENLLAATWAAARTEADAAFGLAAAIQGLFRIRAREAQLVALDRMIADLAEERGDATARARTRSDLGCILLGCGRYTEAIEELERSLPLWRAAAHRVGEAVSVYRLGRAHAAIGQWDDALRHYEDARRLRRLEGNQRAEAELLGHVSRAYVVQKQYDEALDRLEQSLLLYRELADMPGEAMVLGHMGCTEFVRGDLVAALGHLDRSVRLAHEVGHRNLEATMLWRAGEVHDAIGDHDAAHERRRRALDLLAQSGRMTHEECEGILASPEPALPSALAAMM